MKLSNLCFMLGAIFLTACQPEASEKVDLYGFVPTSSIAVAEVYDLPELLDKKRESHIMGVLERLPALSQARDVFSSFTHILPEDRLAKFYQKQTFLLSLNLSGADKFDLLICTQSNPQFEKDFSSALGKNFDARSQAYSGTTIYSFSDSSKQQTLYLSSLNGALLISLRKNLVEEAIRQHSTEFSLAQNPDFVKLLNTRNQKDILNLFVNLEKSPAFLKHHFPKANAEILKNLGSWAELDWQSNQQQIIASGLLLFPDPAHYTNVFNDLNAHNHGSARIIPSSFALWVNYNIGNVGQFYRNYRDYLLASGQLSAHEELVKKLPENTIADLNSWVDNEIGYFQSGRTGQLANSFAYLKYRTPAPEVSKSLENFADSSFLEGYRGKIIRRLSVQNLLPRVYGKLFREFHFPYYTLMDNYVLFGNNPAALKVVINDLMADKTLSNLESYQKLQAQLPGGSHISAIAANPEFLGLLADESPDAEKAIENFGDSLSLIKWGALQMKATGEGAFTNLLFSYEPPQREKVIRKWTTQLPAPLYGEPQLLLDHRSNKYNIAIEDENNILYLLNREGSVIWKYALDGKILGDIRQIDIYKNDKLQLVFNTVNSLYVLDILGRNVEGFPVKLPSPATAPVGVFNYDKARNYRLVIPAGPDLLNYNVQGKAVTGWNFKKAASNIVSEPQHFSVAGKDIIVALSADGKLYQLNRRGEERFTVDRKIEELKTSFYLKKRESLKESELLAGSNSGKMYVINPQGKVDAVYLEESKPADHLIYFNDSYIFSHEEELVVKNEEHPFSAAFKGEISSRPKAMILNNRFYTGAYSRRAEEIRVFNAEGELLEGFPIFAQGPFDMGSLNRDGKMNLVTYSEDGTLICYQVE